MPEKISLSELGVEEDPGTAWHPRVDKEGARNDAGHLVDLDDDAVMEHAAKPEAAEQIDASGPLAAEDSAHSPDGEV